ncbi:MAG: hypothetical protein A3G33_04665 [Omnitrophica bacterium RIFCSPLOWO2_12_FULL_44_17]|uniref:Uncharacterized protein n=1 Tax=Candidatus Danuiimicrobium aquiferis TaxID=1801832 RepID=A0A1G1KQP4_9BACT|nr:MAG: hypothetical protein A3B72_10875 [Omnitrophica bacterium RIFCSPHIGHO2_02_FULL_45_28]OGW88092.1 MAG: hypothetical protein A3E74_04395 [Omnitrophica bacterium RIFCSPHIGHO2_12_FULL_44_12]OGW95226.1 MAG: hypothetical protein A3G33_04665 [Omnitrophica bacterium RIFCSPLOWO2_12_FULL_44_17]OGX02323.1 MAG: hypothetical protein A3J12_09990 [Omnitrophica bacterium RIFCSPLOWO2_02_FULL_44_11]
MKILLINQVFYPDCVSTAQHLTDLALYLVSHGHEVTVLCGNRAYADEKKKYSKFEVYRKINIHRVSYFPVRKNGKIPRIVSSVSFILTAIGKLLFTNKQDVVICLTSPPLIGLAAVLFSRLKGAKCVEWVMDLNPDEAIAAGWIQSDSLLTVWLRRMTRFIFRSSQKIIVLDQFMKERLAASGVPENKIQIISPWAHDATVHPVNHEENHFRKQYQLENKFVVMYSGNHSLCHPLDTLLGVALRLRNEPAILFYFIGGGARICDVRDFKLKHGLDHIIQLDYQPMEGLSESLSAADLHVVTMGDEFVGMVHPCKIYDILAVGRPFIFIGPSKSHIGEIVCEHRIGYHVEHGNIDGLVQIIQKVRTLRIEEKAEILRTSMSIINNKFSQKKMCETIENLIQQI